ncbi:MAG: hypothetical protein R2710_26390 [Acidimicrobiales bacterium]
MTPAQRHLHHLENTDLATCTAAQLAALSESCRQLDAYVSYVTASIAQRANTLKNADKSAPDPADVMGNKGRTSKRTARRNTRTRQNLGELPGLGEKVADGTASGEHLDAANNAQHGLTQQERAAFAARDAELANAAENCHPKRSPSTADRSPTTSKPTGANHGSNNNDASPTSKRGPNHPPG